MIQTAVDVLITTSVETMSRGVLLIGMIGTIAYFGFNLLFGKKHWYDNKNYIKTRDEISNSLEEYTNLYIVQKEKEQLIESYMCVRVLYAIQVTYNETPGITEEAIRKVIEVASVRPPNVQTMTHTELGYLFETLKDIVTTFDPGLLRIGVPVLNVADRYIESADEIDSVAQDVLIDILF